MQLKNSECLLIGCSIFSFKNLNSPHYCNYIGEISSASDLWIKFRYGRQDCANVADAQPVGAEDANDFPDPTMAWTHVSNWCSTVFALNTDEECVALLGMY